MRFCLILMYLEIFINILSHVVQLLYLFLYSFCDVLLEDLVGVEIWS